MFNFFYFCIYDYDDVLKLFGHEVRSGGGDYFAAIVDLHLYFCSQAFFNDDLVHSWGV